MWGYFSDKRYRSERLLLVFGSPLALAAIIIVVWLLASQQQQLNKTQSVLTADQVEPTLPADQSSATIEASFENFRAAFDEGRTAEAMEILGTLPELPRATAHAHLAKSAFAQSKLEEAIDQVNQAILLNRSSDFFRLRGDFFRTQNDLPAALADYEEALSLNPSDVIASNRRLLTLIQQGQLKLVEQMIQLRVNLGVSSQTELWIFGAIAVELEKKIPAGAASLMQTATAMMNGEVFDTLLNDPVILPYQNDPLILPFFIKTSTVRSNSPANSNP